MLTEQQPAFPLGHATPDTPLDPVVQSLREAIRTDRATRTKCTGPLLFRSLRKQSVFHPPALCAQGPVLLKQRSHVRNPQSLLSAVPDRPQRGCAIPQRHSVNASYGGTQRVTRAKR